LCALALLSEVALRLLNPEMFRFVYSARQIHRYPGWNFVDLRPNRQATLTLTRGDGSRFLDFTVTTNELGLRRLGTDDPGGPPAPDGKTVIHCLGDSFTMGWGVEDDESYPAVLARKLGDGHLVLNLGVDGFGLMAAAEKSRRVR